MSKIKLRKKKGRGKGKGNFRKNKTAKMSEKNWKI